MPLVFLWHKSDVSNLDRLLFAAVLLGLLDLPGPRVSVLSLDPRLSGQIFKPVWLLSGSCGFLRHPSLGCPYKIAGALLPNSELLCQSFANGGIGLT